MKVKKRIAAMLAAAMLVCSMALPVSAETDNGYCMSYAGEFTEAYEKYYLTGQTEKWERERDNIIMNEIGGPGYLFLCDAVPDFKNNSDKLIELSYEVDSIYDRTEEQMRAMPDFGTDIKFEIYTRDSMVYDVRFKLDDRLVYSVKEIIAGSGIDDIGRIGVVCVTWNRDEYIKVTGYSIYDSKAGWNNIDGDHYYVKADGTLATKPCVIKGVFYKFDQSGVCKGKYTGFAKISKGTVYYKNGVRVRNKTLITKNGTRYKADKNGILIKI